jgi:hypothetical protein
MRISKFDTAARTFAVKENAHEAGAASESEKTSSGGGSGS